MSMDARADNVVSLAAHRLARDLAARPPELAAIEAAWEALAEDGRVPARAALDPRAMAPVLEHAFLLERLAPGIARIRVSGRHLAGLAAVEPAGLPVSALFLPEARAELAQAVEAVFAGPARLTLALESPAGIGRAALPARLMLWPLRDDLGRLSRALGGIVAAGEPGRRPRRFRISGRALAPLAAGTGPSGPVPPAGVFDAR